jgi:ABC-type bacteriocin/lantibiotic exporter with double-glycine peptidase domain
MEFAFAAGLIFIALGILILIIICSCCNYDTIERQSFEEKCIEDKELQKLYGELHHEQAELSKINQIYEEIYKLRHNSFFDNRFSDTLEEAIKINEDKEKYHKLLQTRNNHLRNIELLKQKIETRKNYIKTLDK